MATVDAGDVTARRCALFSEVSIGSSGRGFDMVATRSVRRVAVVEKLW